MNLVRIVLFGMALSAGLLAKSPVPRPAGTLSVTDASGAQVSLANYRGNVVLVQFLYTTCHHCAETAKMYEKLRREFGPKGLKVVGVAFNDGVTAKPELIRAFAEQNGVRFTIGSTSAATVLEYLGLSVMTRFVVPQVVIVDRNGVVRVQSEALGSPELQDEAHLRGVLEGLLRGGGR